MSSREASAADGVTRTSHATRPELDRRLPVLSAGPTPHTPLEEWTFAVVSDEERKTWTWDEFRALPSETMTVDVHCVTRWSKLDTTWGGVSVDTLLADVEHDAPYVLAFCDAGYTTNLPLEDVTGGEGVGRLRLRRRATRVRARRSRTTGFLRCDQRRRAADRLHRRRPNRHWQDPAQPMKKFPDYEERLERMEEEGERDWNGRER